MATMLPLPTPQTTLVVLLGASDYPEARGFNNQAYANSAEALRAYFLHTYGLPEKNLRYLFDRTESPSEQEKFIGSFLETRIAALKQSASPARDVMLYYVGHGGFSPSNRYHLFLRHSKEPGPPSTKLAIESLASTLKDNARHLRRIVLLDACFAANAPPVFGAPQGEVAARQIVDVFHEPDKGSGFPLSGTSLLCATNQNDPAVTPEGARLTAFTEALLSVLTTGDAHQPEKSLLSLRSVHRLMVDFLTATYHTQVPRPELHSPDQSKGEVADVPLFPNLASRPHTLALPITDTAVQQALPIAARAVPHKQGASHHSRITRRTLLLSLAGTGVAAAGVVVTIRIGTQDHTPHAPPSQSTPSPGTASTVGTSSPGTVSTTQTPSATPLATQYDIAALAWSPNGQMIASGSTDSSIVVQNVTTGKILRTIQASNHVQSVAWSPDGTKIASGSQDGSIQIWNATTGHLITRAGGAGSPQQGSLSWSPDNTKIVSAGAQLWDASSGKLLFTYPDAATGCPVAWSPDGTAIASGGTATVHVWNATTYQLITRYDGGGMGSLLSTVAWSLHGTKIAASYMSGTLVNVWDTNTGQLITHHGSENEARIGDIIAWSPDGAKIVSEDQNGSLQVWDATTGILITQNGASLETVCLAWSPGGTTIAWGGLLNKTVQYWQVR